MIPFVENPFLHLFIKSIAYVLVFGVIEGAFILIDRITPEEKYKMSYYISYSLLIFGLVYFIWIFLNANVNNLIFIASQSSN